MSGRLYTDESGALLVAADGSIHTDDCPEPPCCQQGDYIRAESCETPGFYIYILKSAACTNVSGSVNHAGTTIVWFDECYLVDVTTTYALGDIPGGSIILNDASWPCDRDGCTGELCAEQYVEMPNCGPGSVTDSQRVFVPLSRYNQWIEKSQDQVHGHPCCAIWKINGRCVHRPDYLTQTPSPPAAAYIADAHPDTYGPQYNSCCDCDDSCPETTYTIGNSDVPQTIPDIVLTGCVWPLGSRVVQHNHSIGYSRDFQIQNEDFSFDGTSYGGDYTTVEFQGTAGGTVTWRSNVAATGPIAHAITYTGDCDPASTSGRSSGSGDDLPAWVPSVSKTVFGKFISGSMEEAEVGGTSGILSFIDDVFPVKTQYHHTPSRSYHGSMTLPRVGTTGPFYTGHLDLEWTAVHSASCDAYSYEVQFDLTYVEEGHQGGYDSGTLLHRRTWTRTMTKTMSGSINCGTGTNQPCCECIEEDGGGGGFAAMAAPAPALSSMLGRITRASGASRLARMVRK